MTANRWTISLAISALAVFAISQAAQAAPPVGDYFGRMTGKPAAKAAEATVKDAAQPVQWFEAFDEAMAAHKPTAADRVILSRPFNQEAERVQQWSEIAAKVAKRYRQLAKQLSAMAVPATMDGVKEYRDLTVDWYNDAAAIYEDLIRPRKAAKTMEELEASLQEIKARSQSLAQTNGNLKSMDLSLRRTFKVHLARHEDALQQYVRGK